MKDIVSRLWKCGWQCARLLFFNIRKRLELRSLAFGFLFSRTRNRDMQCTEIVTTRHSTTIFLCVTCSGVQLRTFLQVFSGLVDIAHCDSRICDV